MTQRRLQFTTLHLPHFTLTSDLSGIGGMRHERIRAVQSWRKGPPWYDCVFVVTDDMAEGANAIP